MSFSSRAELTKEQSRSAELKTAIVTLNNDVNALKDERGTTLTPVPVPILSGSAHLLRAVLSKFV